MALYMDIHRGMDDASEETIRKAHVSDLEAQERHGVRYLKYWFDGARGTVCCLAEAPSADACTACHKDAHGNEADEIIEVETNLLEAFLGGGKQDDLGCQLGRDGQLDGAFRTVMFTDIEGSTAMTERLGDEGAARLVGIHDRITQEVVDRHEGRVVKHTGDGMMVSFRDATIAVRCALALQQAFGEHSAAHPEDAVRIRIGLSAGEPVAARQDLFGVVVNLARRVCDAGDAGEVLVSSAVRDLCMGKGFEFVDRGDTEMKGMSEPVRLYLVSAA